MENIQNDLLNVVKYGKNLFLRYKDKTEKDDLYIILNILLHVENVIDVGRRFNLEASPELRSEITKGMDEIRSDIVTLMKKLDKSEIKSRLYSAGEQFKTNFISALKT